MSKFNGGKCYSQGKRLKNYIRKKYNYICQICGEYGYQVDHINPWRVSYDSTLSNLRLLCRKCNIETRRERFDLRPRMEDYFDYLENELVKELK